MALSYGAARAVDGSAVGRPGATRGDGVRERCDRWIGVDLEARRHEVLVRARILNGAGTVTGRLERAHRIERDRGGEWVGCRLPPAVTQGLTQIAALHGRARQRVECAEVVVFATRALAVDPSLELRTIIEVNTLQQGAGV